MLESTKDLGIGSQGDHRHTALFMRAYEPHNAPKTSIAIVILAVLLTVGAAAFGELIYVAHQIGSLNNSVSSGQMGRE